MKLLKFLIESVLCCHSSKPADITITIVLFFTGLKNIQLISFDRHTLHKFLENLCAEFIVKVSGISFIVQNLTILSKLSIHGHSLTHQRMLTYELSPNVLQIPNDAYTTLRQNPIGCSIFSQEYSELDIEK